MTLPATLPFTLEAGAGTLSLSLVRRSDGQTVAVAPVAVAVGTVTETVQEQA